MGIYLGDKKIAGEMKLENELTTDNFKSLLIKDGESSPDSLWSSEKIVSHVGRLSVSASGTSIPYRLVASCTKNSSHKYINFNGVIKYNATIKSDNTPRSINNASNPCNFSVNDVGSNTVTFQGYLSEISPLWDFVVTTDGTKDYLYLKIDLSGTNPNFIGNFNTITSGWNLYRTQDTFSDIPSGQTVITSLRTYYRTQGNMNNGRVIDLSDLGGKFKGMYEKTIINSYASGTNNKNYVIPLINITASADACRFTNGVITFHRTNGAETPTRVEIGFSKRYTSSANTLFWIDKFILNKGYFYNQTVTSEIERVKLVQFDYNGYKYLGLAFDSRYQTVQFEGVFYDSSYGINSDVFAKISSYYEDLITNGTITNASDVNVDSFTSTIDFHHDIEVKGKKIIPDESYSLSEMKIGTWTDGKPLYQKSFFKDAIYNEGWNDIDDISSLNIDSLASLDSNAHATLDGGGWHKAPYIHRDNPALGFDVRLTGPDGTNQKSILQVYKKGTAVDTISITIKYTKTTD